ncbi:MAG: DEAD/DEAH box helicase [Lentisphaeria bacterium]|nr:DEAD/DEAH box helicase [Lentisphaeria bacterium]
MNIIPYDNLYRYQKKAIDFVAQKRGKALIYITPGGGKTLITIHLILKYPALKPVLICCPSSLKLQWQYELQKYFPDDKISLINANSNLSSSFHNADFVIINYDILKRWQIELCKYKFNLVVCDESHKVKNPSAERTKALNVITDRIQHRLLLTGTPITNDVGDLYNQLHLINPDTFNSYSKFLKRYTTPKTITIQRGLFKTKKQIPGDPCNVDELNNIILNHFFRVSEKEVFENIAEMQNIVVPIEVDNLNDYRTAERIFMNSKMNTREEKFNAEQNLAKARKELGIAKINSAAEWIREHLENSNQEKLVIFAYHRDVLEALAYELGVDKSVIFYGGMSTTEKDDAVKRFINDKNIKFFLGNSLSAGTGVDGLNKVTSTAIMVEALYSHAEWEQAKGRVRRKNSTFDAYFCYNLIVPNTLDEKIIKVLDRKAKETNEVLTGKQMSKDELLSELIMKG